LAAQMMIGRFPRALFDAAGFESSWSSARSPSDKEPMTAEWIKSRREKLIPTPG
jgi:hypothetical protein